MSKLQQYRQGDVLITRVEKAPEGLKPIEREEGRHILAHGEVTGHAHAIRNRVSEFFAGEKEDSPNYLSLADVAKVEHEEHGTINLDAGDYEITRQREYSPEAIRNVAD